MLRLSAPFVANLYTAWLPLQPPWSSFLSYWDAVSMARSPKHFHQIKQLSTFRLWLCFLDDNPLHRLPEQRMLHFSCSSDSWLKSFALICCKIKFSFEFFPLHQLVKNYGINSFSNQRTETIVKLSVYLWSTAWSCGSLLLSRVILTTFYIPELEPAAYHGYSSLACTLWFCCRKRGSLPGPKTGLLSNTQKWIVWGDTYADKARDFIMKGHPGREQ